MIDTVRRFLQERGLIGAGSLSYNIIIGRSYVFDVFQKPDVYITVKTSKIADLRREFDSQTASHATLPDCVPAPLAFGNSKGLWLLASEGVVHTKLNATTMRSAGERLAFRMGQFARRSTAAFADPRGTSDHRQDLESAIDRLSDGSLAAALAAYARRVGTRELRRLPHVRQHGDLVASNIGVTASGIVIFDWEDFGRVKLPGFDIGVLLASCLGYDAALLTRWFELGEPRELDRIIAAALLGLDLTRTTLWRLLPAYLVHFLFLKRTFNYRPHIGDLVRRLITDLCDLPEGTPYRSPSDGKTGATVTP